MPSNLRFVQTGDWHLGQAYRGLDPEISAKLRTARLEAVERVLHEARRRDAAFVLVCGDQFDGSWPSPELVRSLLERIAMVADLPVHMIPGNHDPCLPGSVYERSGFRAAPANLRWHDAAQPCALPLGPATLYPCPCRARHGANPLEWIPPRSEADGWRIGLAHGSLPVGGEPDQRNFPIPGDAPERYDLDYLALGDWHAPTPDPVTHPGGRMYYAGAPEVGGWDETRAGWALEVTLVPGSLPVVIPFRIGRYEWIEIGAELHGRTDLVALENSLLSLQGLSRIVRVLPRGALTVADRQALEALIESRRPAFASLHLDPRHLRLVVEGECEPPRDPLLQEVQRRLIRLATNPTDGLPVGLPPELPQPDSDDVQRALARFRDLLP